MYDLLRPGDKASNAAFSFGAAFSLTCNCSAPGNFKVIALILVVAAVTLAGGHCVLAATFAGRAHAGCALTMFRFTDIGISSLFNRANNRSVAFEPPIGIV